MDVAAAVLRALNALVRIGHHHQVHLVFADVVPHALEPEIRTIGVGREAQQTFIEGARFCEIGDDQSRVHHAIDFNHGCLSVWSPAHPSCHRVPVRNT